MKRFVTDRKIIPSWDGDPSNIDLDRVRPVRRPSMRRGRRPAGDERRDAARHAAAARHRSARPSRGPSLGRTGLRRLKCMRHLPVLGCRLDQRDGGAA